MQALHFTYGIGSFVAPLICEPFLSGESIHTGGHGIPQMDAPSTVSSLFANSTGLNGTETGEILPAIDPIDFLIYIPYAIAGAITVFASLVVLVLYYVKPYESPVSHKAKAEVKNSETGK